MNVVFSSADAAENRYLASAIGAFKSVQNAAAQINDKSEKHRTRIDEIPSPSLRKHEQNEEEKANICAKHNI